MTKRIALITGVTGQDGAYLSEFLLSKGYEVHGIKRRSSLFNTQRVDHIYRDPHEAGVRFFMHYGDMTDSTNLIRIIQEVQPDEIYNLAAQSHVQVSFETPEYTAQADALGALRLLEAIRILKIQSKTKFYQASTSELYGRAREIPQNENTPFYPRSPYGIAKLYAYWITVNYREAYNMFACNGILFNHESPIRGETFVTRKITRAVARIVLGLEKRLYLGNLDAKRDWGHARDYVEGMWMMMQQKEPCDYVLATGETHSVREFVERAFKEVGIGIVWMKSGVDERGVIDSIDEDVISSTLARCNNKDYSTVYKKNLKTGDVVVGVDSRYFRPTEVEILCGDSTKARRELGWKPNISFEELVKDMVVSDLEGALRDMHLMDGGFRVLLCSE